MAFCEKLSLTLNSDVALYDLKGNLIEGKDIGFISTDDIYYMNEATYIRISKNIIAVKRELSQDAVSLVKLLAINNIEEAADYMQPLEYILKNNVSKEELRGRFIGYSVLYIQSKQNIKDILESIYETTDVSIVEDDEGIYLVNIFEDAEQEAESIIDGISQETGTNVVIGIGRKVGEGYTIKDSANHAKACVNLVNMLGFKEGVYHIDKMIMYGILHSCDESKIDFYLYGGYNGFYDVLKDKELLDTAEELFRCHLNVSEASRKLYLHRNTLLYRLEKIKNLTGLDIKKFEEAVIFRTVVVLHKLKRR